MKKSILIARANFQRAKGQTAATSILVLLAALMLNLWLALSTDYKANFDRYHDKLHAEHVSLVLNDNREETREFISETLKQDGRTVQYCMDDCFFMVGMFAYHDGEVNTEFVILDKETAFSRSVGAIELLEENDRYQSGVYLPMLYGSDGRIAVGETQDFEGMLKEAVSAKYPEVRAQSNSYTLVASSRYISRMICSGVVSAMAFLVTVIALVVWLPARRIRRIEPITALREGIRTHSFRKNHVPLERTSLPLQAALALKTTLSGVKQNVTMTITMLALSLIVAFSGLMLKNVIIDMEPFVNMIVGETADSCININIEAEAEFLERMRNDVRVEKVYLYHTADALHVGGIGLMGIVTDDFSDVNNQEVCMEGRYPRYDNETAVAVKYAGEKDLHIGDEITMAAEGNEVTYLICGFTQISNNLGRDCLFTRSGYERMGSFQNVSYYL